MKEMQSIFPQDLYTQHLSVSSDIHFTMREIDVIACIINARKTSKIASLLSINIRTVETHIRNIMFKLNCNSQEGIIDFIETSGKLPYLRKYYALLRLNSVFEKSLLTISKLNKEPPPLCFIVQKEDKNSFSEHLESHLKLAGIRISTTSKKKEADYILCILSKTLREEQTSLLLQKIKPYPGKILFVLQEMNNQEFLKEISNLDIVDFREQEDYYFSFFDLLKKLLPNLNFETIINDFRVKAKTIPIESRVFSNSSNEYSSETQSKKWFFPYSKASLSLTVLIIGLMGFGFLTFQWYQKRKEDSPLRSDLILPKKPVLLDRIEILNQIENKLKNTDDIQTIALVGPGGAGKTTLARQYAHKQKTSCVWEINAETRESLNASFEKLAYVLVKTDPDLELLRKIQETQELTEKENKLIQFIKERLRLKPCWLLIYDNVVTFADIQKFFPHDPNTWGCGKVILTTRDSNIENNNHVDHIIPIEELDPSEKLSLFTKIMTHDTTNSFITSQKEEVKKFLENIPPLPLDILIAAYYLKATNAPFSTYLENLTRSDKDFMYIQESILREAGEYTKGRYSIITLSLKKILETHQEFESLLLLMMLLDSQDIPRDLLNSVKGDNLADNFIFNLKKYSLLTNVATNVNNLNLDISIHRSTQAIGLSYLLQNLGLNRSKEIIESFFERLTNYVDKIIAGEDLHEMKSIINHYDALLKHKELLAPHIEAIIKGQLGTIYYFLGNNIKAKALFEESLLNLNNFQKEYPIRIAMFIGYLGNAFRDLGKYDKARNLLEQSISIYATHASNDIKHAYFLIYLGIIERYMGHYDRARSLFEQGLAINKNYFPQYENYAAWVSGQLGVLEREYGNYEKAKNILEASLKTFQKDRSPDHFDIAWALEHLGPIYTSLREYKKAKEALEQSLKIYAVYLPDQIGPSWILALCEEQQSSKNYENITTLFNQLLTIYKNHFHDNYIYVAWSIRMLGILYTELRNYKRAKILLEQALLIYQKNYGEIHLDVGKILNDLGKIYLLEGDLKKSKSLLLKALKILQQNNHLESYISLETLADLLIKKSTLPIYKTDMSSSENFKKQAISYLQQALEIANNTLGNSSLHSLRIKAKLEKLSPTKN